MRFKFPKSTKQFLWTNHVAEKMRYYGLSEQKITGVIRRPFRKEEGVVEKTIAVMQPVSPKIVNEKKVWKSEVWVMYQKKSKIKNQKAKVSNPAPIPDYQQADFLSEREGSFKIISAWRYPGVSPKKNPVPEEILRELEM